MRALSRPALGVAAALALLGAASEAHADPCASQPSPIYGLGGSAQKPLIAKVATALAAAATPITVVFQAPGACVGYNGLSGPTNMTGTASYWTPAGVETQCTLTDTVGDPVGFANMGNTAVSCPGVSALPTTIGDFEGPVDSYDLIVPLASDQTVISSEAAYFVFGFGMAGMATPWIDETQLFVRDQNSAAQLFIGLATGVPASKFKGVNTLSNQGTITAVAGATTPKAAIGLVSGEVYDANRATVRALAYQHAGQRCGFTPDSTSTSFDKANVRNGQYEIWSPIHFFTKIDGTGKPLDTNIATLINLFTSTSVDPVNGVDILNIEVEAGNIPRCAMKVWRDTDLGPISKNTPAEPCGCYFDSVATGTTTCQTCTSDTTCPASAPKCRRNFCEVN